MKITRAMSIVDGGESRKGKRGDKNEAETLLEIFRNSGTGRRNEGIAISTRFQTKIQSKERGGEDPAEKIDRSSTLYLSLTFLDDKFIPPFHHFR